MRVSLRLAVVAAICSIVVMFSRPSEATPTPEQRSEAKAAYEEGLRKYDVGKWDEASELFQKAYELVGDPRILFNIAQSFRNGQRYEKAILFYKSYLRRMPNPPNRGEVEKRIAEMQEILEKQRRTSEAPPTGINRPEPDKITEQPPPTQPTETPPAPPAPTPKVAPASPEMPSRPAVDDAEYRRRARTLRFAGIGVLAVGVVALATGGAMSGLALSASNDVETAAAQRGRVFDASLQSKESNGKTFDVVGIAMYAVGGVAAAAGAALIGISFKKPPSERAMLSPSISPTSAGIVVGGVF
jgi:tetratricopeptide (TPR) repeat protein